MIPVRKAIHRSTGDPSRFYCNYDCKYFPCHETDSENFNCIFCYCPMYYLHSCLGSPQYLTGSGSVIKDCSRCDFPHRPENYETIIEYLITSKKNRGPEQESCGHSHTFVEESVDAVLITSHDGSIIDCNRAALDLFGYAREEIMGITARCLYLHPVDRIRFQNDIEQNGFVADYEVILMKKDGTVMECLLTSAVLHANDGSILGYQSVVSPVRRQAHMVREGSLYTFTGFRDLPGGWSAFQRIYE
ncbi:MAG: PAS domain-containing protein [Nitrospirae bacterium]|nr:PAS domain-containing protein [Nitrospirota bacterium]